MLNARSLTKTFGRTAGAPDATRALDGVDLDVAPGEILTVLGPSGCGKTTLLRVIAGFETPDAGTLTVGGREVFAAGGRTVAAHDRGIGLVPQEGALFPHLSVAQNVGFGLRHLRGRERRSRVQDALELVGLARMGSRRPHELSGGQQQRVALARAIAPSPKVVLLDEPFSALDEYLRESLRTEVHSLLRELGTTAILVTHDQEEALALGDRVAVMRAGRIVQAGTPRQTYFQPRDLELARFLGDAVVVPGRVSQSPEGCAVACPFGTLPVSCDTCGVGPCDVLIRPENIALVPAAAGEDGLAGTITGHTFYGHDGLLRVHVPELGDEVSVRVLGDHAHQIGEQVRLRVDRPVCTYPPERVAA